MEDSQLWVAIFMKLDILAKIWKSEIDKINDHLPRNYKTLETLLESKDPHVITLNGDRIPFERKELEFLASIVPKEFHGRIQLPIVFIRRIDMGEGVFSIGGGKVEQAVVMKLLGEKNPFSMEEHSFLPYIYRHQVLEVRKKIRSLTTIGFATTKINLRNSDLREGII
ncbi:MAG: DUF61 family protein [Candidatus Jordarchaeaceae archaeon]